MDIRELRSAWVMPRVERVTTNTFKLYQVREQLKRTKVSQEIVPLTPFRNELLFSVGFLGNL